MSALKTKMEFSFKDTKWFYEPKKFSIDAETVTIQTDPETDFWQRTYYGFRNDNAHVLYNTTNEEFFSFTVNVRFKYNALFDQCGVAVYQDGDNWAKAGIEFNSGDVMWLGSVVTNNGYSDWATVDIDSKTNSMWYRLSRRKGDFLLEHSHDGATYRQMRIFHLFAGGGAINFGLLACSPGNSSFEAVFSDMKMSECLWKMHEV